MILSSHGIIGSSIGQFDADAAAFFARVTAAGGTLSATEKTAVNTLVVKMKFDGIWNSMKAIYPMVGASAAACAKNLKSSSFTGSFSSGWTFASTGVTPNGTSAYMDTGLTIGGNISLPSISLSYYSRTVSTMSGSPTELGVGNGFANPSLYAYYELNIRRGITYSANLSDNFTISVNANPVNSSGFYNANRTSNINLNIFRNGIKLASNLNTAQFLNIPANNLLLAAIKDGNNPIGNFSNRECAIASISDGLTDTQASNFYTAVQAFQTTLGRQV